MALNSSRKTVSLLSFVKKSKLLPFCAHNSSAAFLLLFELIVASIPASRQSPGLVLTVFESKNSSLFLLNPLVLDPYLPRATSFISPQADLGCSGS